MTKGIHIRAARALLNMTTDELSAASTVTVAAISKFENGTGNTQEQTIERLKSALERRGVFFTGSGVELRDTPILTFDGPNWFVMLLDDVHQTLSTDNDMELIVEMGNDALSADRPDVMAQYRRIRAAGIKMRCTIEQGNTFMLGDPSEYRMIPSEYFRNWVTLIYANKYALCIAGETHAIVFEDKNLTDTQRLNSIYYGLYSPPSQMKAPPMSDIDYKVSVKSASCLGRFKTARLDISVGMSNQQGAKFKATLDWATARFDNVILQLADTLQRHNIPASNAHAHARARGDQWLTAHQHLFVGRPEITLIRWDDRLNHPAFAAEYARIQNAYGTDPAITDPINQGVDLFIARNPQANPNHCREYMIEEMAVFSYLFDYEPAVDIYPGTFLPMPDHKNKAFMRIDHVRKKIAA